MEDNVLNDLSNYEKTGVCLGNGTFGFVYLVRDQKTKEEFALKRISLTKSQQNALREITVMKSLKNPCLCPLLAYQFAEDGDSLQLLLPFFKNGSLDFVIKNKKEKFKWWDTTTKMKILYGIAYGMAFMHSKSAIHRDLKPANVLLDNNYEIKITDFGTSRFFDLSEPLSTLNVGTPSYTAPEIINGEPYDQKIDVFSYAITMYEVLFEKQSFKVNNAFHVFNAITSGKRPELGDKKTFQYGEGLYNLIQKCWSPSSQVRPSFDDILQVFPSILPADTNMEIFNEYVNRINPDAAKNKKIPTFDNLELKKFSSINVPKNKFDNLVIDEDINLQLNKKIQENQESQEKLDLAKFSSTRSTTVYNKSLYRSSIMVTTIKTQATMGNPKEMYNFGLILYCGDDEVQQDIPRAISFIKKAAEKKNIDAIFWLGMHYFDGTDGIEINMEKARNYIKEAADNGRPLAQFFYGFYCERGCELYPPEINPEKATHSQKKKYVWPPDKKESFNYIKAAAEKGHAISAFMIAKKYENGISADKNSKFSLPINDELATKFYKMAADAGHIISMIRFAQRANVGIGMKRDAALTLKYMKSAADADDMHALFYYGTYFLNGINGCKQNIKLGAEYIQKAADKGLPEARSFYASILETGLDGVEKNVELAQKYKVNSFPNQSPKK